jgi:hypothetical protein
MLAGEFSPRFDGSVIAGFGLLKTHLGHPRICTPEPNATSRKNTAGLNLSNRFVHRHGVFELGQPLRQDTSDCYSPELRMYT